MDPFTTHRGRIAVLDWTDVNTDLIIPARYLKLSPHRTGAVRSGTPSARRLSPTVAPARPPAGSGWSGPPAVGRRARASMVRRQRVGPRLGRAGSEAEVDGRLCVGKPVRGLVNGAREGLLGGPPVVDPTEAAVERLQRSQQQAERD